MKLNRIACQFVDHADSRPIPLVIATSTDNVTVVSDNAGYIVLPVNLPTGTPFYISVTSAGYEIPADAFGYRGFRLTVGDGISVIKLRRQNIAQRSGRLTGTGKYIHAQALGKYQDFRESRLTGMDSVQTASMAGTRYVFYGDTNWTGYPLGNFKTTNGTIKLTSPSLPNCPYSVDFSTDSEGKPVGSFHVSTRSEGVIWISGIVSISNTIIGYANHRMSLSKQIDHGFVKWNPRARTFEGFMSLPEASWKHLDGHPITINENGFHQILFGHAIPNFRVPANVKSIQNGHGFETFSCLLPNAEIERGSDGKPVWRWRTDGTPIDAQQEIELIRSGKLTKRECRYIVTERSSGRTVIPHRGSVRWNQYLKRWLLVFTAINEPDSMLGELFVASSTTPMGPWTDCTKVATHPKYSYYNPVHHDWLDQDDGRIITVEGTYTLTFSGNTIATPGFEYNQLAYQIDLRDKRLSFLREPSSTGNSL